MQRQLIFAFCGSQIDHNLYFFNFINRKISRANAIKYAFAKTDNGKISISLSHISESQILLSISDNGRGLPVDFDSKIGASMGMELLQGLTDDLGGSFSIETNEGTHIKVIFSYKPIDTINVSIS